MEYFMTLVVGSGGMFDPMVKFVEAHSGKKKSINLWSRVY